MPSLLSSVLLTRPSPPLQTVMGAEELPLSPQAKKAADVFSAGVLIFWTLTGCQHPFGEEATQRTANIMRGDPSNLGQLRHLPDARHLVSGMVQQQPEARLLAEQARQHPCLWTDERKLLFVRCVADEPALTDDAAPLVGARPGRCEERRRVTAAGSSSPVKRRV